MLGYSANEVFTPAQQAALRIAANCIEWLPEEYDGELLRCHEIARIVQRRLMQTWVHGSVNLDVQLVDGNYGIADHSWLVFGPSYYRELESYRNTGVVILDPYCVGRLPVAQLVHAHLHFADLYRPGPRRTDIRNAVIGALS